MAEHQAQLRARAEQEKKAKEEAAQAARKDEIAKNVAIAKKLLNKRVRIDGLVRLARRRVTGPRAWADALAS